MKTKFISALGTLCVFLLLGTIGNAQVTIYSTDFGSVANVNPAGWTFTGLDFNISTNTTSSGYIGASGGAYLGEGNSVAFNNTSGNSIPSSQIGTSTATLLTSTLGYSNISIAFGMRKSSAGYNSNANYKLEWSTDGVNYNPIAYTEPTDGTWGVVSGAGLTLPPGAANQAKLYIKWTFDRTGTASNYKIDDFKVTGQIPQTIDYSFVVIGCNRVDYTDTSATMGTPLATGPSTANVYQLNRLFTEVSQLNPLPKYLFMAGDVVMGYINDTVALATQLRNWRKIYENHPLSQMGITLVVVPGNHETQDKAAGKKSFVAAERTFLREMAPYVIGNNGPGVGGADNLVTDQSKLTYSFNNGLDHFIILDTDPVGKDGRVPYKWVASDIRNARLNGARHIFAIGHKPAYASPLKPLDGLESSIADRDSLWKHLENNQCEAMVRCA
jgi:hypothetical protein